MIAHRVFLLDYVYTHLEVGTHKFNRIKKFKHLGTLKTQYNEIQEEIKAITLASHTCYFGLDKWCMSRILLKSLKVQPNKTIIRPVVMY